MIAEPRPNIEKVSAPLLRDRKHHRFTVGDDTMIVRVRESPRAKTARIIVGPRRPLEVIVPRGTSDTDVDAFLEEKRGWVEAKVADAYAIAARLPQLGLDRPGVVWLGGRELPIERGNGQRALGGSPKEKTACKSAGFCRYDWSFSHVVTFLTSSRRRGRQPPSLSPI